MVAPGFKRRVFTKPAGMGPPFKFVKSAVPRTMPVAVPRSEVDDPYQAAREGKDHILPPLPEDAWRIQKTKPSRRSERRRRTVEVSTAAQRSGILAADHTEIDGFMRVSVSEIATNATFEAGYAAQADVNVEEQKLDSQVVTDDELIVWDDDCDDGPPPEITDYTVYDEWMAGD